MRERRPPVPFTPHFTTDLYTIILPNLSFKNLNQYVESNAKNFEKVKEQTVKIIKKTYPLYIDLKTEKLNKNYPVLIDNLVNTVFPLINSTIAKKSPPKNEATYRQLCLEMAEHLGYVIDTQLYSRYIHHQIDPFIIRNSVFHYCQYTPEQAGKLLNKNILENWNSTNKYITDCLIEYGADVNAKHKNSPYPTLFHAVTFNASPEIVRKLIDHGADYYAYQTQHHGVTYTVMLVAALNGVGPDVLTILAEKFPQEVDKTIKSLEIMLTEKNDNKFPCEYGKFEIYVGNMKNKKIYYSLEEISNAKKSLLSFVKENNSSPIRSSGISFFNPLSNHSAKGALTPSFYPSRKPGK